jgi:hypothetical protein
MKSCERKSSGKSGQALVLFTLMVVVFVGFCALVVDVGRVYAERRYMQNGADAGALAATGLVAASLMPCDDNASGVCSGVTMNEVVQRARAEVNANASLLANAVPYTAPIDVVVRYARYDFAAGRCGTTWATMPATSASVFGDTCKLRVEATSHWTTWFPLGVVADFNTRGAAAGANATGMIVGDETLQARGDVWPMTRRRSNMDPALQTPSSANPTPFWYSQSGNDDAGGANWKGQISLALNSKISPWSTTAAPRNQPLEGSRLFLAEKDDGWNGGRWFGLALPNLSTHGGGAWDTRANNPSVGSNFAVDDNFVDLGNWFAYGYRGTISVTSEWWNKQCGNNLTGTKVNCQIPNAAQLTSGLYSINRNGNNGNTTSQPWWKATGDWVETYQGDLGANMRDPIDDYMARNGQTDCPFSARWGKCVVMVVYMWEGGQLYDDKKSTWDPWNVANKRPDRVHIVDFAYFAFYENLPHSSSSVEGFFVAKAEEGNPTDYTSHPSNRYNYYFMVGE